MTREQERSLNLKSAPTKPPWRDLRYLTITWQSLSHLPLLNAFLRNFSLLWSILFLGNLLMTKWDLHFCYTIVFILFLLSKMNPSQLAENQYFISSAPVNVYYQNGRLAAEVRTPKNVWRTYTSNLDRNTWYQVCNVTNSLNWLVYLCDGYHNCMFVFGFISSD